MTPGSLVLCTDLDRTLLPNGTQPESPGARQRFADFVRAVGATLVYVTGRDRRLVEAAIAEFDIPQPNFVVSDVGATIYDLRGGEWRSMSAWHAQIAPNWAGKSREDLADILAGVDGLMLQEQNKQARFKLSYYLPLEVDWPALERAIRAKLAPHRVQANLIHSVDEMAATGLLDILPADADKYQALEFLRALLGVERNQMLFAGDSANDLAVLVSPLPAVLVANAAEEVAEAARAGAARAGTTSTLYVAAGGRLGLNGNYSAGILEGVLYFHPELSVHLEGA